MGNKINYDKVNSSITEDTKKANIVNKVSLMLLLILTLGSFIFYTERYFNKEKNKQISTQFKTLDKFQVPVVFIKYEYIPNGYWSVDYADWNYYYEDINYVYERPTQYNIDKESNNTVYIWYNYTYNITYMAIISTSSKYLVVSGWDDGNIDLSLVLNQTTTQDKKTLYLDILAEQHAYSAYMWVFERDTFVNNLDYYYGYSGFNAQLVVNPAHYYDTSLDIEMVVNRIKKNKPRKRIYDLNFNGASGDYNLISYGSSSIVLYSTVSLSPPEFGRVIKFSTTKQWGIFDVVSSAGGFYSIASLVLFYIFGWLIWGTGLQYVDKYKCCGLFSHAEPDDYFNHRQTQNAIIKTHIILTHKYDEQKEDFKKLIGDMGKISEPENKKNIVETMTGMDINN